MTTQKFYLIRYSISYFNFLFEAKGIELIQNERIKLAIQFIIIILKLKRFTHVNGLKFSNS